MATTIIGGSRGAIPGIDGGTFTAAASPQNTVIRTRFAKVFSLLLETTSSGTGTQSEPRYTIFNQATSAGASILSGSLNSGGSYSWIAYGLGG